MTDWLILTALLIAPFIPPVLMMAWDCLWFRVRPRWIRRREEKTFAQAMRRFTAP